jgi:hypothetical protein
MLTLNFRAYPTAYFDYGDEYKWSGTLQITSSNSASCVTATTSVAVTLTSHPSLVVASPYIWNDDISAYDSCITTATEQPVTCTLGGHTKPSGGDQYGINFKLTYDRIGGGFGNYSLVPELKNFENCSRSAVSPESFVGTVNILTATSVSHEGDSSTTADAVGTEKSSTTKTKAITTSPEKSTSATALPEHQSSANSPKLTTSIAMPTLVVGSQTVTTNTNSEYVIASQTLTQGGTITLGTGSSATVVVLKTNSASQSVLVVGGSTSTLPPASQSSVALPTLVIGSVTVTANSKSQYVISGQTLAPGGSITIGSGTSTTVVALTTNSASQTVLVVRGSSTTLSASTSSGIGSYIIGGLGGGATASSSSTAPQATTNGAELKGNRDLLRSVLTYLPFSLIFCSTW